MKPKHQRLVFLLVSLAMLAIAATLILRNFKEELVFFYSPAEVITGKAPPGEFIRIGGLVKEGSLTETSEWHMEGHIAVKNEEPFRSSEQPARISFLVTDTKYSLGVTTSKTNLPALFREGQGVVAEGFYGANGIFYAERILAKHDENYMPPEVARALKAQGHWKEGK